MQQQSAEADPINRDSGIHEPASKALDNILDRGFPDALFDEPARADLPAGLLVVGQVQLDRAGEPGAGGLRNQPVIGGGLENRARVEGEEVRLRPGMLQLEVAGRAFDVPETALHVVKGHQPGLGRAERPPRQLLHHGLPRGTLGQDFPPQCFEPRRKVLTAECEHAACAGQLEEFSFGAHVAVVLPKIQKVADPVEGRRPGNRRQ